MQFIQFFCLLYTFIHRIFIILNTYATNIYGFKGKYSLIVRIFLVLSGGEW